MRSCGVCLKKFPVEKLIIHGNKRYFLCSACKSDVNRLGRFGLTPQDFKRLLEFQDYKCAICFKVLKIEQYKFAVDHCHDSTEVRGVLCITCNMGLARFDDDPDRMLRAAEYINNPPAMGLVGRHNGKKKVTFLREEYRKQHGSV